MRTVSFFLSQTFCYSANIDQNGLRIASLCMYKDIKCLGAHIIKSWIKIGKGQITSKANCQDMNYSKKRTNEFVFTTMRRVFVHFVEEIEDTKKTFRNYLTFNMT